MIDPVRDISDRVKRQMNQRQIHEAWERTYRTPKNEQFFEQAYDRFVRRIGQPSGSRALDIGCGICANAIRLARRGYAVSAADYSEPILVEARENVARHQLSDRIAISREDILNLSYPNNYFDLVLCWGVLMHVPDAERAVSELARVAKPGGFLVFEEINKGAPEAWLMRKAWSAWKKNITITETPRGYEQISRFADETLFWRHLDSHWLTAELDRLSCSLVRRDSGMFSEMYTYMPGDFLKNSIHGWNRLWPRWLNITWLAYHNILIYRKRRQSTSEPLTVSPDVRSA